MRNKARALVPVYVIQCTVSGNFIGRDLAYHQSLSEAGRLYHYEDARNTAIGELGPDYEIHQFWELAPDDDEY